MIKKIFLIAILLLTLLIPASLLASSDVGFIIKKEAFSLSVRVSIGELDPEILETFQGVEEITTADKLFFECLKWVYSNEKSLSTTKADVVVWWSLSDRQFNIQVDETESKPIRYTSGRSSQELLRALEKKLKITSGPLKSLQTVPLFIVKSKECMEEQWERTEISFGAIPGYTYSDEEKAYVVMLWSLDKQSKWIKNIQGKGAKIEQVQVDKKYIKYLLGHLE